MLDNVITLPVDVEHNSTDVDTVFTRFDEYQNRSVYISDGHQLTAKDTLSFYRSFPKANGNFRGTAKTSAKFSKEIAVDGVDGVSSLSVPMICEVSFSLPVGATDADVLELRQRAVALLDLDTVMDALNLQQQV